MNKPVSSELSECVFALIRFHLLRSSFPARPYSRDNQPHQYLKCILIKHRLHPRRPRQAGGWKLKEPPRPLRHPPHTHTHTSPLTLHQPENNNKLLLTRHIRKRVCAGVRGRGVGRRTPKHGQSNGGLNIYDPLDPPLQCGCAFG